MLFEQDIKGFESRIVYVLYRIHGGLVHVFKTLNEGVRHLWRNREDCFLDVYIDLSLYNSVRNMDGSAVNCLGSFNFEEGHLYYTRNITKECERIDHHVKLENSSSNLKSKTEKKAKILSSMYADHCSEFPDDLIKAYNALNSQYIELQKQLNERSSTTTELEIEGIDILWADFESIWINRADQLMERIKFLANEKYNRDHHDR